MIKALVKKIPKIQELEAPEYLIREEIDGQPLYYRAYKAVLNNEKNLFLYSLELLLS